MATVNPLGYESIRNKTINKINSDMPRCINNINNIINQAAGEGRFYALVSLDQEGFSVMTIQKSIEEFEKEGYELITEDNRMIKISWELEK